MRARGGVRWFARRWDWAATSRRLTTPIAIVRRHSRLYDRDVEISRREHAVQWLGLSLIVAWIPCAVGIWGLLIVEFGDGMSRRGMAGLGSLIYFVPVGAGVVLYEYVLRPHWFGPTPPGRHVKRPFSADEVRAIDKRILRSHRADQANPD